jgi:hypothetical protein
MLELLRRLQPARPEAAATEIHSSGHSLAEIKNEYAQLIQERLERAGVPASCFELDVRHMGAARDGRDVLAGMIRLTRWERQPIVRVLLGLPLLEKSIRRRVRASWLAETTWFGGLWLHASSALLTEDCSAELRTLIADVELPDDPATTPGSAWATMGPEEPSAPMPLPPR